MRMMGKMLGNDDSLDHASLHKDRRRLGVRHNPLMLKASNMKGLVDERRLLDETVVWWMSTLFEEGIWIVVVGRSYKARA